MNQQLTTNNHQSYTPISCNYYDELEAIATLRKRVEIIYFNKEGNEEKVEAIIKDFFVKDKVEYMLLDNSQSIRLDYLRSVDGKELKGYC